VEVLLRLHCYPGHRVSLHILCICRNERYVWTSETLCSTDVLTIFAGPTLEEIAMLFDGDEAAVADEERLANRLSEKAQDADDTHVERRS
jgi:hypothetical protein